MSTACGTPGYVGKPGIRNGLVLVDGLEESVVHVQCIASQKGKNRVIINNSVLFTDAVRGPRKDWVTNECRD